MQGKELQSQQQQAEEEASPLAQLIVAAEPVAPLWSYGSRLDSKRLQRKKEATA